MGKNKNTGGKGASNAVPPGDKPPFTNEEKSKVQPSNDNEPVVDNGVNSKANGGTSPTTLGATANQTTFPGARRGADDTGHILSSRTQYMQGMYWHTGDIQVLVGETHEYRLHQEILARYSSFFSDQLRVSTDSDGIIATRSEDIPVVVLRDITGEEFDEVLRLLYPSHVAIKQPSYTTNQAERLLRTSSALGMPGVIDFAMDILSRSPGYSVTQLFQLAQRFSLVHWQTEALKQLVYRTRPLSNDEAIMLGAVGTAQVARLREYFRARVFARFEPVTPDQDTKVVHRSGVDSDAIIALNETVSIGGLNLGQCQQSIFEALRIVFDVDGNFKSHLARYLLKDELSILENFETWLRLGTIGGGATLCKGCADSIGRLVQVYCRVEEMDLKIEDELRLE